MSAIDTALSMFQQQEKSGKWMFFSEIYGGTNSYIDRVLQYRRGINVLRYFPEEDGNFDLEKAGNMIQTHHPTLLFFEIVSNPMLSVVDAEKVINMAKSTGCRVIIDNTFATPYLYKPLAAGADTVIHSATKYLAGHNNLMAGVICGNEEHLMQQAVEYRKWVGHSISPDDACRLGTQLKTFELRMQRHNDNAARLAKTLAAHPNVGKVLYPGLESHPTHQQAARLFKNKGFGGMITFDLKGADDSEKQSRCAQFLDNVKDNIPLLPSLGDVQTTFLPVEPVWGDKYPFPGMIRLSVGIEPYEDIEKAVMNGVR